jgi:hypothetical protein
VRGTLPTRRRRRPQAAGGIVGAVRDTDTTPAPIFSAEDGIEKLWVQAYQGEVLGERLFEQLADRLQERGETEHAAKMHVLATLERRTKDAVAPALERAGISIEPEAEMLGAADVLAGALSEGTWDEGMASFEGVTGQYLALYARIGELDPAERAASQLLEAHEEALRAFARAELAGETARSLDPINALDHMR